MRDSRLFKILAGLVLLLLYLPIILVVVYSFNDSRLVTVWGGWSLRWYQELWQDEELLRAGWVSIKIAFMVAMLSSVFGVLTAWVIVRYQRFSLRPLFGALLVSPLVIPDIVLGLSLLLLFVAMDHLIGWPEGRGVITVMLAHASYCTAYISLLFRASLARWDPHIEEAALVLGARPWTMFRTIILPQMRPALLSGWLLALVLSFDDVVVAGLTTGPQATTLPLEVFSRIRLGVSPTINALASLVIVLVIIIVGISLLVIKRSHNR